ncbi:hypothetical protein [Sinorhizobium sp. BJ1]|uniref:DUF7660 family protein n=1 Tax=Sinorhizobium sp. BJ1 TaxID=2035455 RepID=UPI000BEAA633|nr:hypothetical protein [Sinorhizobium sp. BJ1]PDT81848.1 hypothetical protein CO676_19985 [Sinorhizobium sp. BJ1]
MNIENVIDQQSFLEYLASIRTDFENGAVRWENTDLASYLEAMSAWLKDSAPQSEANPWKLAAFLLQAGAFYE